MHKLVLFNAITRRESERRFSEQVLHSRSERLIRVPDAFGITVLKYYWMDLSRTQLDRLYKQRLCVSVHVVVVLCSVLQSLTLSYLERAKDITLVAENGASASY